MIYQFLQNPNAALLILFSIYKKTFAPKLLEFFFICLSQLQNITTEDIEASKQFLILFTQENPFYFLENDILQSMASFISFAFQSSLN
jgi:hypothetical protein